MVLLNTTRIPKYDDKARLAGVEIKIIDGGSMVLVDPTRGVNQIIKAISEYKNYCRKYY